MYNYYMIRANPARFDDFRLEAEVFEATVRVTQKARFARRYQNRSVMGEEQTMKKCISVITMLLVFMLATAAVFADDIVLETPQVRLSQDRAGVVEYCVKGSYPAEANVEFNIDYYRVSKQGDEDEYVSGVSWSVSGNAEYVWGSEPSLLYEDNELEEGEEVSFYYDAYLCIWGENDEDQIESEHARTEVWTFTTPRKTLATPRLKTWNGRAAEWNAVADTDLDYYHVMFAFSADPDGRPRRRYACTVSPEEDLSATIFDQVIERYGSGYYYFMVQAVTRDITQCLSSPWSDWSEPLYIAAGMDELSNIADSVSEQSSPAEIRSAVQQIQALDTDALAAVMKADKNNTDAVADIEKVETLAGATASVEVAADRIPAALAEVLHERDVLVIGAGLNAEEDQSVKLVIDEIEDPSIYIEPTMYYKAVQFSMALVDTANGMEIKPDSQELAVPVKITIPVPAYYKAERTVIIHHHADGTNEIVHPHVESTAEGNFASFVVTRFSDFSVEQDMISAEATDSGVELSAILTDEDVGEAAAILCAVYDADGRMLDVSIMKADERQDDISLICDGSAAQDVQILLISDDLKPEAESLDVPVE